MRILVISRNAWDDTNSIGNTLTNFFKGIDDLEVANIFFRSANPNNNVCCRYYRVTEGDVLKKWFLTKKIGREFIWKQDEKKESQSVTEKKEKKIIQIIHKYGFKVAYKISDYIWYSRKWINDNLQHFIESFKPDVMITFVKSAPQYYLTIRYLREKYNIPLFAWIADDEYSILSNNSSFREINNLRYILRESSVVCGCSEEICEYYNTIFNCNAIPLYKGCDLSTPLKKTTNSPIKIVYAGNLMYGRLEVINKIADVLNGYNGNSPRVSLEIYSNTSLFPEEKKCLEQKQCLKYMGRRDYEVVMQCLANADIVLHVESFEKEQIVKTKYSFSTKIVDCLQSGSCLLAVGPKEVASVNYIKKIQGAYVIDNLESLEFELVTLLNLSDELSTRAKEIREFAINHHDLVKNSEKIKGVLNKIVRGY